MRALGRILFLAVLVIFSLANIARADTAGVYYITDYGASRVYIVSGHTVVGTFSTHTPNETPIAVSGGTVRLESYFLNTGTIYDLGGNVTGQTGTVGLSGMKIFDGTSDGSYNYFIFGNNGTVYQTGLDFSNGNALFTGIHGQFITYDPTNNSLWVSGGLTATYQPNNVVYDYAMDGTLLGSFTSNGRTGGLAFDPTDSTLWFANLDPSHPYNLMLDQYSRSGTLLDTMTLTLSSQSGRQFLGGEFMEHAYVPPTPGGGGDSSVPEPATIVLLCSGLFGFGMLKRNRS